MISASGIKKATLPFPAQTIQASPTMLERVRPGGGVMQGEQPTGKQSRSPSKTTSAANTCFYPVMLLILSELSGTAAASSLADNETTGLTRGHALE